MSSLNLSAAEFRALAATVSGLAADYYAQLPTVRAYPPESGAQVHDAFAEALPNVGLKAEALAALTDVMKMSRAPSARFYGYVLGSGEPVAALGD